MPSYEPLIILRKLGYRDTQPRRLVVAALEHLQSPSSPYDIAQWIEKKKGHVSPVTIYRITTLLEDLGIVHRHPCSGLLSLCRLPGSHGVHGYLHCHSCGSASEFSSKELSVLARKQAKSRGFVARTPLMEIVGTCRLCAS